MAAMLGGEHGFHLQSCIVSVGTKRQPRATNEASDCLTKVPGSSSVCM